MERRGGGRGRGIGASRPIVDHSKATTSVKEQGLLKGKPSTGSGAPVGNLSSSVEEKKKAAEERGAEERLACHEREEVERKKRVEWRLQKAGWKAQLDIPIEEETPEERKNRFSLDISSIYSLNYA